MGTVNVGVMGSRKLRLLVGSGSGILFERDGWACWADAENALSRSGVALWSTVVPFPVRCGANALRNRRWRVRCPYNSAGFGTASTGAPHLKGVPVALAHMAKLR